MDRAYSLLEIRSVSEDARVIEGIASTPTPDRYGDIVEPLGAKFALPMPLLWQHHHDEPVGHVEFAKPTKAGIPFKARIAKIEEPGRLKDRVDEAWQSVKAGLVRAVSIGFRSLEHAVMKDGGYRFLQWEWLELSLVTVPANADATLTSVKAIDTALRAASGTEPRTVDATSVPAPRVPPIAKISKGRTPMAKQTIAEQISAYEASRAAKAARMDELMTKAAEEGVTLDAEQAEEYDTLDGEVKQIDEHLVRLARLEKANVEKAKPVNGGTEKSGSESRAGIITVKRNLPPGTAFTRYAMALAKGKGNLMQAAEIAKHWHDSTPEVETVLKAAVAAGTTTDSDWAAPLVEYQNMASEFIELLRPATIIGRIPGFRRVPFNVKIPGQTTASTAGWVGEGAPKPVSELAFNQTTLGNTKVAGIVVLTEELVRFSNPSAEALVRQDLIDTITQLTDHDFVDPAKAESLNVSPASVTNGVTPVVASGTDADAVRADVKAVFQSFIAANLSVNGAVWIMTPTVALSLAMMLNPLGQPEFPGLTATGGTWFGLPVITSENIPDAADSAGGSRIILAKPSEILLADDGQVMLDVSREASLEMDSAPTNPPTASTVMRSLWQMNLIGIRAERFINWKKRRAQAVAYIDNVLYGDAA